MKTNYLKNTDPHVASLIDQEHDRLEHELNLIASENYTSHAVMQATGSVFTNKYAEGYPGKRYYGGCAIVDKIEMCAIERCKKLFGAEHVNVQPHAGSQANMAVYNALLEPGDTVMGMSLSEGGHLTHGHAMNFSGKLYNFVQYRVNPKTECLDFDEIEKLAHTHKPKLMVIGASAYPRILDFERFAAIANKVGALVMADIAHIAGLVATGLHPSPFPHVDVVTSTTHKTLRGPRGGLIMCKKELASAIDKAIMPGTQGGPFMHAIAAKATGFGQALEPEFKIYQKQVIKNAQAMASTLLKLGYRMVTGGTDNHMLIVDLTSKGINGKIAEEALYAAGITVSRSCIPFDTQKPWITSGIRIGTPAITTRGMKEDEVEQIAHCIDAAIKAHSHPPMLSTIKKEIVALCQAFPIYLPTSKAWVKPGEPIQKLSEVGQ